MAVLVFALGASAAPLASLAAVPSAPLTQQGEQIQRQQQDQIDQDQTRILTSPRGQTVIEVPTHPAAVAPPGSCKIITAIAFENAPRMSAAERGKLIKPYVGRCLGLGDVENLLSDITRFYVQKGEPTTRIYIQPQTLAKGQLVLKVVEGKVEKIVLDNKGLHGVNLTTAFGDRANRAFNLRVFEQGLDQINRLASNNATIDIAPGDAPGESIIHIRNTAALPLHLSVSYDNTGEPQTGRNQGAVTVIGDDLLHLNDQISYTRRQTIPDGQPNANAYSDSVLLSVPYNALTLTLGYNDSAYTSQSTTSASTPLRRSAPAAANAAARGSSPSGADVARPSVSSTTSGRSPSRSAVAATSSAQRMPAASGVRPPVFSPSSRATATSVEPVGRITTRASFPRNATSATRSRRW